MVDGELIDADLVRELEAAAGLHGVDVALSEYLGGRPFEAGEAARVMATWPDLRMAAGLESAARRVSQKRYTNDDLLAEFDRLKRMLGKDPTWAAIDAHASMSRPTFQNRFGNMPGLREAHRRWVEVRDRAAAGDEAAGRELAEVSRGNGTLAAGAAGEMVGLGGRLAGGVVPSAEEVGGARGVVPSRAGAAGAANVPEPAAAAASPPEPTQMTFDSAR